MPFSRPEKKISFERALAVAVVIIFCTAATFSAFSIIRENREISGGPPRVAHSVLENAYGDLEDSLLAYAGGSGPADAAVQAALDENLRYFQSILNGSVKQKSSDEALAFKEKTAMRLEALSFIIRNLGSLPPEESRRQIISDVRAMRPLFSAASIRSVFKSGGEDYLGKEHLVLFASVMVMGLSGLGLIALLLHKIGRMETAYREAEKTAGLLEPRMAAVESSRDGIGITSGDGAIGYVNQALAQFHGYDDVSGLIGKPWQALYSPVQKEWMETEVIPVLKKNGRWQGHCTGLRRDGSEFYQDIAITQLADGGMVWIVRDYSEMMETISISNRRLAAIEAAGDGIGLVDKDGRLTYINKALMKLHGISDDKLNDYIGMPWENLYTMRGREEIHQSVLPALRKSGHWKGEAPIKRVDDKVVVAEMSLTLLPDGGLIGTARDVTDRKQAEKEKDHLQKQFFQAQKMEAIGRLAGGIAHDFNNILASMLGYAEFLLEDIDEQSKQHDFARQIMHGGRLAQKLVEQILAFSRRKESARERLDLAESASETAAMLRATLPPTISLDLQVNAGKTDINGNATQISQILMNLCVNARDAMTDDRGTLRISLDRMRGAESRYPALVMDEIPNVNYTPETRFLEPEGGVTILLLGHISRGAEYVRIGVEDTGCGMDRAVMEHIFEPFFTTKELDKGTGLGLSTVHGMMAGHQAALVVSSAPGKGTRFDLYFPAMDKAETSGVSEAEKSGAPGELAPGKFILLVEDDSTVRDMLRQMLERIGFSVACCDSGDRAVDHLRENPDKYDLVLSDHMMPDMTGVEMAEEIRQDFPALPVVLISGYSPKKLEDAMAENPSIRAVLKKPVTGAKLHQTLISVLGERRKAA